MKIFGDDDIVNPIQKHDPFCKFQPSAEHGQIPLFIWGRNIFSDIKRVEKQIPTKIE